MSRRGLARLARLEARARRTDAADGPAFIAVYPDEWPAEDRLAFDGDDAEARADAIERQTGLRPGPRTFLMVVRYRPDARL